jgi:hypothetical protein
MAGTLDDIPTQRHDDYSEDTSNNDDYSEDTSKFEFDCEDMLMKIDDQNKEEGCKLCGKDTDHGKLIICDRCEGEYHTFCLEMPLQSVPENEFFCGEYLLSIYGINCDNMSI